MCSFNYIGILFAHNSIIATPIVCKMYFWLFWNLKIILAGCWLLTAPLYKTFLSVIMLIEDDFIDRSRNNKMDSRALNVHSTDAKALRCNAQTDQHLVRHTMRTQLIQSDNAQTKTLKIQWDRCIRCIQNSFSFFSLAAAAPQPHMNSEATQRRFTFSGEQNTHACLMRSRLLIFD